MQLTVIQNQLIQLLTKFIQDEATIVGILLTLKTEKQQETMIDFIIQNKDNLTKQMIMEENYKLIES